MEVETTRWRRRRCSRRCSCVTRTVAVRPLIAVCVRQLVFFFLFFSQYLRRVSTHTHTHAHHCTHQHRHRHSATSYTFLVIDVFIFSFPYARFPVRPCSRSSPLFDRPTDRRLPRFREQTQISKPYRRRPTETTTNRRRHVVLARLRRQTLAGFQVCDQGCYCRSRRHRVGQIRRIRREY